MKKKERATLLSWVDFTLTSIYWQRSSPRRGGRRGIQLDNGTFSRKEQPLATIRQYTDNKVGRILTVNVAPAYTLRWTNRPYAEFLRQMYRTRRIEVTQIDGELARAAGLPLEQIMQVARAQWVGRAEVVITAPVGTTDGVQRRYFLYGFDHQEFLPHAFICMLPVEAKPTTVAEAYEALKPESVKLAESQGKKVLRQGDLFFIPAPTFKPAENEEPFIEMSVRGTNHVAKELVLDGTQTYVRGAVYHRPEGRHADHATIHLPRGWYLVTKNTVPV